MWNFSRVLDTIILDKGGVTVKKIKIGGFVILVVSCFVSGCASLELGYESGELDAENYVGGIKGGKRTVGHKRDINYYGGTKVEETVYEEPAEEFVDIYEEIDIVETEVEAFHGSVYVVQKKDTLWKIAGNPETYGDSRKWLVIFNANRDKLDKPEDLQPGMELVIPRD